MATTGQIRGCQVIIFNYNFWHRVSPPREVELKRERTPFEVLYLYMNSLNSTIGTFAELFENSSWAFTKTVSSHFQIILSVGSGVCPKKGSGVGKRIRAQVL